MYRKTSPSSGGGGGGGGGGGETHKMSGIEGERIGVNCVAWEGEFPHWF